MTEIDLKSIVTNSDNSRESAPTLQGLGYGIVEPIDGAGKPSLFSTALGSLDDKQSYYELVEQYEEELVNLAESIDQQGQLQNCRVRSVSKGKFALTFGARRCLAVLYLHAKHGKKARVMATVSDADSKAALMESAAENIHLPPSYIDQARLFKRLCDEGMTVKEIAKIYPMGKAPEQNIRHRLRLLDLPQDVQLKVHHGKLSQEAALKLLKKQNVEGDGVQRVQRVQRKPADVETEGEETKPKEGPPPEPLANLKTLEIDEEPLWKEPAQERKNLPSDETELRAILLGFLTQLSRFDFDALSVQDPTKLLRLVAEAQKKLATIKGKFGKGKAKMTLAHA